MVPTGFFGLCPFFLILFPFRSSDWIISMNLSPGLLILPLASLCMRLNPCSEFFSYQFMCFSTLEFLLDPFYDFCMFIDILFQVRCCLAFLKFFGHI